MIMIALLLALPLGAATEKRIDDDRKRAASSADLKVTIDVKDAEARVILEDLRKQCGVKNLMIDPDVKGTGTFLFKDVPCSQAWGIVLRSMGLDSRIYSNSVVTVGSQKNR
jgi:type II secretory pathway component HofQ